MQHLVAPDRGETQDGHHEPQRERQQRDGGEALDPPVMRTGFGRAEAAGAAELGAPDLDAG
jgi:hypothetical protein